MLYVKSFEASWHYRDGMNVTSQALPGASLDQALQRSKIFTLPAKRALYREGDRAEALYALRRGSVKLLRKDENGKPRLVRLLGTGNALGLEAVTHGVYCHTAIAVEPLEFNRVPVTVLRQLQSAGPGLRGFSSSSPSCTAKGDAWRC